MLVVPWDTGTLSDSAAWSGCLVRAVSGKSEKWRFLRKKRVPNSTAQSNACSRSLLCYPTIGDARVLPQPSAIGLAVSPSAQRKGRGPHFFASQSSSRRNTRSRMAPSGAGTAGTSEEDTERWFGSAAWTSAAQASFGGTHIGSG
jgi:hypothetical protein